MGDPSDHSFHGSKMNAQSNRAPASFPKYQSSQAGSQVPPPPPTVLQFDVARYVPRELYFDVALMATLMPQAGVHDKYDNCLKCNRPKTECNVWPRCPGHLICPYCGKLLHGHDPTFVFCDKIWVTKNWLSTRAGVHKRSNIPIYLQIKPNEEAAAELVARGYMTRRAIHTINGDGIPHYTWIKPRVHCRFPIDDNGAKDTAAWSRHNRLLALANPEANWAKYATKRKQPQEADSAHFPGGLIRAAPVQGPSKRMRFDQPAQYPGQSTHSQQELMLPHQTSGAASTNPVQNGFLQHPVPVGVSRQIPIEVPWFFHNNQHEPHQPHVSSEVPRFTQPETHTTQPPVNHHRPLSYQQSFRRGYTQTEASSYRAPEQTPLEIADVQYKKAIKTLWAAPPTATPEDMAILERKLARAQQLMTETPENHRNFEQYKQAAEALQLQLSGHTASQLYTESLTNDARTAKAKLISCGGESDLIEPPGLDFDFDPVDPTRSHRP